MNQTQKNHAIRRLEEVMNEKIQLVCESIHQTVQDIGLLNKETKALTVCEAMEGNATAKRMLGAFIRPMSMSYHYSINLTDPWEWPKEAVKQTKIDTLNEALIPRKDNIRGRFEELVDQIMMGDEQVALDLIAAFRKETF